jgi:glycosyltransferase involved in cell wall biosynthesis
MAHTFVISTQPALICAVTDAMLHFVVFSFNRGDFLANCLASLKRCAPDFPVLIIDDNSTDPGTINLLAEAKNHYRVIQPPHSDGKSHSKHGGLYGNLQLALDTLSDEDLICTVQDDMQLIRNVTTAEASALELWFAASEQRGFVHHAFMKGSERRRNNIDYHEPEQVYYNIRSGSSVGSWYSDIFIASVGRLRTGKWQFGGRESLNEQQAKHLFKPMAYWQNPFVAWLPAAPTWRGKRRTLALRLGEKKHHCGLYPLQILQGQAEQDFLSRSKDEQPYAEIYLNICEDVAGRLNVKTPWVYHPLQGSRWLKWLNSLELKLRKIAAID